MDDTSLDSSWHTGKSSIFSCTCPLLARRKRKFKVIVDVVRHSSFNSRYIARKDSFTSRCETRLSRSSSLRAGDKSRYGANGKDVARSFSVRDPVPSGGGRRHDATSRQDSFKIWNKVATRRKAAEVYVLRNRFQIIQN